MDRATRSIGDVISLVAFGLAACLLSVVTSARGEETPAVKRLPTVRVVAEPDSKDCGAAAVARAEYECLNVELASLVARQAHQRAVTKANVTSSLPQTPTAQGLFNQTAMRIRMGNTFGRSVYPQRVSPQSTPRR